MADILVEQSYSYTAEKVHPYTSIEALRLDNDEDHAGTTGAKAILESIENYSHIATAPANLIVNGVVVSKTGSNGGKLIFRNGQDSDKTVKYEDISKLLDLIKTFSLTATQSGSSFTINNSEDLNNERTVGFRKGILTLTSSGNVYECPVEIYVYRVGTNIGQLFVLPDLGQGGRSFKRSYDSSTSTWSSWL